MKEDFVFPEKAMWIWKKITVKQQIKLIIELLLKGCRIEVEILFFAQQKKIETESRN